MYKEKEEKRRERNVATVPSVSHTSTLFNFEEAHGLSKLSLSLFFMLSPSSDFVHANGTCVFNVNCNEPFEIPSLRVRPINLSDEFSKILSEINTVYN